MKRVNFYKWLRALASTAVLTGVVSGCALFSDYPLPTESTINLWPQGRSTAVALMFDDGCESQIINAVPWLEHYDLPGTFFVVPRVCWVESRREFWEQKAKKIRQIHFGNHTATHYGADNFAAAERELHEADVWLRQSLDLPKDKLMAFGAPQGVKWQLTDTESAELLTKYHLIERPATGHAVASVDYVNAAAILDLALAKEPRAEVIPVLFYGVDGDWFSFEAKEFKNLLAVLAANRNYCWVAPVTEIYCYQQARQQLQITSSELVAENKIRLELDAGSLPEFCHTLLSISTKVPANWRRATVKAGKFVSEAVVKDGVLHYDVPAVTGRVTLLSK